MTEFQWGIVRTTDQPGKPWPLTGNCPVREHTADGVYVGRCGYAHHGWVCPRHGRISDYSNQDDRDVAVADRNFAYGTERNL